MAMQKYGFFLEEFLLYGKFTWVGGGSLLIFFSFWTPFQCTTWFWVVHLVVCGAILFNLWLFFFLLEWLWCLLGNMLLFVGAWYEPLWIGEDAAIWLQGGGQQGCPKSGMWPTKPAYCNRTIAHCFLAEVGCRTVCYLWSGWHQGMNRLPGKTPHLTDHQVHTYDGESRCLQYQYLRFLICVEIEGK